MDLLQEQQKGNRVFRITFPNGERYLFRLLSWKEFNTYWSASQKGVIPKDLLEDTIFRHCSVGGINLEDMGDSRAGIITTITSIIMQFSGPAEPLSFNDSIELARQQIDSLNSQIVMTICRAFPAYTPESIEQMSWPTILIRLAQAERILMSKQPPEIYEPIRVLTEEEQEELQRKAFRGQQIDATELVKEAEMTNVQDRKPPKGDPRYNLNMIRGRQQRGEMPEDLSPEHQRQMKIVNDLIKRRHANQRGR